MSDARFKVTYRPGGDALKEWEVDLLDGVKVSEMIAVKKASGISGLSEFLAGVMSLDPEAMKALVWLLLKRDLSTLSWDELDFPMGAVQVDYADEFTDAQLMDRLARREAEGTLNEAGIARLAELRAAGVKPEGVDPKA
jgi:hypothetical protein